MQSLNMLVIRSHKDFRFLEEKADMPSIACMPYPKARRAREMSFHQWQAAYKDYVARICAELRSAYLKEGFVVFNEDALLEKLIRYIYETSSNRHKSYHFLK